MKKFSLKSLTRAEMKNIAGGIAYLGAPEGGDDCESKCSRNSDCPGANRGCLSYDCGGKVQYMCGPIHNN